ncbi:MAG: hypothetical protein JW749_10830 [Sedimentisphaerales bacterium]|nr:hypothetical protein [Sedimentisphaerales bacterium]
MRCQRCQFENIPGESRCFKCGSVLGGAGVVVDIHPPRMPPWKRPLRSLLRWFRLHSVAPEELPRPKVKVPAFMRIMSKETFVGLILSIVPGLAHYIDGRFREVRWFVLGWFLALLAGISLYGGNMGLLLLGIAVGLHGWIAFQHTLLREIVETARKFGTLTILLAAIGFAYWGIRSTIFSEFVFGHSNLAIPFQNVQNGDLLLGRRSLSQPANLNRGDFVLVRAGNVIRGGSGPVIRNGPIMAGQIVGFSGDTILIAGRAFIVNGQPIDSNQIPVPEWITGKIKPVQVPNDTYFISDDYNVVIRGNAVMNTELVERALLVGVSEIQAKAVMRWLPLGRRGFLRTAQ